MVVAIVIVVMIIPITLGVPAVIVFVPPTVAVFPAVGASLCKFMAPVIRLGTLPAVFFDGLVKLVVRFANAPLTVVVRSYNARTC